MAKFIFRVFLAVILLFLSNRVNGKANFKDVEEKLKQLNKPAVKTIQSEDGDIIDCVEIYKQPAFDHPALRNHVIQAATLVTVGYNYIGAKADINVWNPNVESEDEFTTAQIWLKAGPGDNFESLESGWMVNPQLYGDKKTRFFAHWTKDSYKTTGCFDLHCSGFVQTSSKVAFGGALEPVSTEFGQQYYINVGIFMDPNTNNWWLKIKEDLIIGYWPASSLLFYLNHSSTIVEWGGQVYSPKVKKSPHTKTGMGSGQFAWGLQGNACYMDNIAIVDFSMQLKYPQWVDTWVDEEYCYTAYNYQEGYGTLPVFYFGGPGQNYNCP
ncbi:hypothetical protein ERO13_A08G249100v2 [Gossypium hirsutum]|uniref:Neprosin PEP catalytic domain-containing protein n=1 Tax=Gossypium barbadense TaxID=3634 RepID=A0A5J5UXE9_GOSBA|nr:hypothetical protein ES319_A08G268800v1 [Gossypium barbadense]KAG4189845.1 hypothetical protein ERO13_A08G249100v2 [Gossypium hirsutum]